MTTASDTTALSALVERLERGEVGRRFDIEISEAFGLLPDEGLIRTRQAPHEDGPPAGFGSDALSLDLHPAPRLTTSIDAVVALHAQELPGWRLDITGIDDDGPVEACMTHGVSRFLISGEVEVYGRGPTEPAARLAALLRALIAKEADR